ncbi:glycosyltransferase family 4 protein [Demetria terragena]|uniref:glycosyltransferase family 4 protein n=1 Tax=Demetria terragena TaxID=63959 RepID=UPI00035F3325|nr:glycosyltransferase family 4 protein [Demetria terragena]
MRVLYLSWRDQENPEAGGAETFAERTAEGLTQRGHSVTFVTSRFPGSAAETRHGSVRILRRGNRFTCYARGLAHVARHRHDYDVIVDIQNGVPFWSPLVARCPVVNVTHHVHREQWPIVFGRVVGAVGWVLESKVAPLVYRRSRYVTVSMATRADLVELGVSGDHIDVVYSGNDRSDDASLGVTPRSTHPLLCVLGRLVPHKHVEQAIDLVADLQEAHPGLSLAVVGAGYWQDELEEHARARGVFGQVHFHGFVDDSRKQEILARSWVLVVPSHKEGWGLNIVEAGIHGTPAVAYAAAGGPSESIRHGRTGLLATDRADLTRRVESLLADGELRGRLGHAAERHARTFDWDHTAQHLEQSLLSVLGQAPRPELPHVDSELRDSHME